MLLALVVASVVSTCPEGYREHPLQRLHTVGDSGAKLDVTVSVSFCDSVSTLKSQHDNHAAIHGQADFFAVTYVNERSVARFIGVQETLHAVGAEPIVLGHPIACRGEQVFLMPPSGRLVHGVPIVDHPARPKVDVLVEVTALGAHPMCTPNTDGRLIHFAFEPPAAGAPRPYLLPQPVE